MTIDQAAGHAVAALVNTHGSPAPLLDAVVMAAVKGNDPRQARPAPKATGGLPDGPPRQPAWLPAAFSRPG
jgi:hypothetical protein